MNAALLRPRPPLLLRLPPLARDVFLAEPRLLAPRLLLVLRAPFADFALFAPRALFALFFAIRPPLIERSYATAIMPQLCSA
jgi:hypothetical protein